MGLCPHSVGSLALGTTVLEYEAVGWGQVLGKSGSLLEPMPISTGQSHFYQSPFPHSTTQRPPCLCRGTLYHLQLSLAQSLIRSLLFPLGPELHTMPSKSGVSVSQLCGSPMAKSKWSSKLNSLRATPLIPRLQDEAQWKSSAVSTPVGKLLWYNYFPVCGLPTQCVWGLIYRDCVPLIISLWLLLCLCMWGIFLVGSSIFFVSGFSTVICDLGVSIKKGWSPRPLLCHIAFLCHKLYSGSDFIDIHFFPLDRSPFLFLCKSCDVFVEHWAFRM